MIKNLHKRFFSVPHIEKLSKFQREEYAKLWFDVAKLIAASLILKSIEPGSNNFFDFRSFITMIVGLTAFWICVKFGLYIGKEKI